jgi:hypothetical protein
LFFLLLSLYFHLPAFMFLFSFLFLPSPFPSPFVPYSRFRFDFSYFYIYFILLSFLIVYLVSDLHSFGFFPLSVFLYSKGDDRVTIVTRLRVLRVANRDSVPGRGINSVLRNFPTPSAALSSLMCMGIFTRS